MVDDRVAAEEIGRQMERLRGRVALRGVMGYLDESGERKDVNKLFLNNTVRSVDAHNRRHEEAKCWKAKELEEKLERRQGRRSRSRSPRRNRRHRSSRSRSRSRDRRRRRRSSSPSEERRERSRRRSRSRDRRSSQRRIESSPPAPKVDSANEREYWARKKAEKTKKIWEGLHAGGSVSVQNAPAFVSNDEDSSDGDIKVRKPKQSRKSKK